MEEAQEITANIEQDSGQSKYFLSLHWNYGQWNTINMDMNIGDAQKAIGSTIQRNNDWQKKTNGKNFDDGSGYMIVSFFLPSNPKTK